MPKSQAAKLKDKKIVRRELLERISNVVPKSCSVELMAKKNRDTSPEIKVPTILDFAESFIDSCDQELDVTDLIEIFAWSLLTTGEQVKTICNQTVAQSKTTWQKQQHGRITASEFKDISCTVTRIKKNPTIECAEYLISAIMGYEKSATTWQMNHGINTEIHAKTKSITKKSHMTYADPGMTVFEDYPFLAATSDLEIYCAYHDSDLVEIKCSATLIAKTPDVDNYKHIEICNDNIALKMTSPYYSQIQGQLTATKRSYCDLFTFSFKGNLTVRVDYNHSYWEKLLLNLEWLWKKVITKNF